ncbi:MAG TPA: phosphatidylserine/phosphatidylglycerophosphate/cardiolipin synthase family protein [Polyangiaceae bacterium]
MSRNFVEPLIDGHRILPSLLTDIGRAKHYVHVSVFLFFRDPIGEEIAAALEERARGGVTVRVLLNLEKTGMGDPFSTGEKRMMKNDPNVEYDPLDIRPLCERMRAAGIEVVDTDIDYDKLIEVSDPRLGSVAAQIRDTIEIDELHIDHRKVVIIDGAVAYVGGANFGAQYLYHEAFDPEVDSREEGEARKKAGLPEPWWKWHDSLTRFEGPIALEVDAHFRDRWILDGGEKFELAMASDSPSPHRDDFVGVPVEHTRVLTNCPDAEPNEVRETYVRLIREARRSIFIENPYLYHPAIVDTLCDAKKARPDLRVVLVLPNRRHNDNSFAEDAQQHHYPRYLECGIELYEYHHHFNHLKIAVFDGRYSIHGSTNLNFRSLDDDMDFELNILVDDEELGRRVLSEVRNVDIRHARRISKGDVEGVSFEALRIRMRDPRTLLLVSRRLL